MEYPVPDAWLLMWWTIGICAFFAVIAEFQSNRRDP